MRLTWPGALAVASLATVGLVACGDDDDRLTEDAFLKQGNTICEAGNKRIDRLFEETFESEEDFEDQAKQAEVKQKLEADVQDQIEDVGALEPPEQLQSDVETFLDDAEATLKEVRAMSPQEFFESEEDPFEDVNGQAEEIGLTECAGGDDEEGEGEEEAAPGHTVVEVNALEYAFELGSTTLGAGPTAFHLVNAGTEEHELSFAKIAEGHTLQEAVEFEGDPEAAGLITEPSGDTGHVGPGEDIYLNVELEPGTYGMVCFVEASDGTPHAFKGMVTEFTVQ